MNPRVKEAILWGVVGLLSFLVLLQGYELLQEVRVELAVKAGTSIVVFVATMVITYVASGRVSPHDDEAESTGGTTTAEQDDERERENGAEGVDETIRDDAAERDGGTGRDDEAN